LTAAEKYATKIVKGKLPVSEYVKQAAQRFLELIKRDDIDYDIVVANKVCDWFEKNLCHWEGQWRGKPFILEDWQKFILQQIFGLKREGRRLITKAYIEVARKNSKTTFSAGISLYHLFADTEQSPQILVGANNEDQAKICTTCAANMLEQSPNFAPYIDDNDIKIYKYRDRCTSISYPTKNGRIDAISRDLKTKDGFNPSLGIIDEYHEADNPGLLNVIRSGQGARLEPLLIVITTAGFKKDGPCYSELRRVALDILKGKKTDDSQLALIYEMDEGDDWEKEENWKKANPNFGVSVYPHYLRDRYTEAKNEGASKEVDFKTKNLNVWTDASTVWIQDDKWMLNKGEPRTDIIFESGLDMAFKRDWTAYVKVGKDENGIYHIIPHFWIPESTVAEKVKHEHSSLRDWIAAGLVFTTPGNVTDHDMVAEFILNDRLTHKVNSCVADPAHAISTMNKLNEAGLECMELFQTPSKLTAPTNLFYEIVIGGKMRHGGNPVLRWMMSNTILKQSQASGLHKIDKENRNAMIDGIDAIINGLVPYTLEKQNTNFIAEVW
jgi:phage terminase large subunit-like protein